MKSIDRRRMGGVYVVEFAIIGLLLFTLLFGVLEMGRQCGLMAEKGQIVNTPASGCAGSGQGRRSTLTKAPTAC